MQQLLSIVTPFRPRMAEEAKRQMHHSVYLDEQAEHLYETTAMCDRLGDRPPSWDQLPQGQKARYRREAEASVNRLDDTRCHQAELRAREAVALKHFGRDFSILTHDDKVKVAAIISTAVDVYGAVLEGFYTELPAFRAAELEPITKVEN